jgi:hypothetical protein
LALELDGNDMGTPDKVIELGIWEPKCGPPMVRPIKL